MALAALKALADDGKLDLGTVRGAIDALRDRPREAQSRDGLRQAAIVTTRLIEVRVPDIGDFKDVEVIDVLVKPGDSVGAEAPLITLETEKATMDVPSTGGRHGPRAQGASAATGCRRAT